MEQDTDIDQALEEIVYQSIGQASMCWSERPKGVFDSQMARSIAQALLQAIRVHEQHVVSHEQVTWQLSHPQVIRYTTGHVIAQSRAWDSSLDKQATSEVQ